MNLLEKIHSKIDKTVKFVFRMNDGLIAEASYIDKDDGKDIICVSTQTGCNLGCKFCFTTDCKDQICVRNISEQEIVEQVSYIRDDLGLKDKLLLVSYMGCGEPLLNMDGLIMSMYVINIKFQPCRFAVATLIPHNNWHRIFDLIRYTQLYKLNLKIHLSLHFTEDEIRKEWMPCAMPIEPAIAALEFYRKLTGNSVEIHYALIEGVNDHVQQAYKLGEMLKFRDIPVKILKYNERPAAGCFASKAASDFMDALDWMGIKVEYYEPPGFDVGASCGQLLMDYYLKYNKLEGK